MSAIQSKGGNNMQPQPKPKPKPKPKQWRYLGSKTDIIKAVKKGDCKAVQTLIKQDPQNVLTLSDSGHSPLYLACIFGHKEILLHLIEIEKKMALDPDLKALGMGNLNREEGNTGFNALTYTRASWHITPQKKLAILRILQKEIQEKTQKEIQELKTAISRRKKQAEKDLKQIEEKMANTRILLEETEKYSYQVHPQSNFFGTNIISAIHQNNINKVKSLIKSNPNYLRLRTLEDLSPLHMACKLGRTEIVKHILAEERKLAKGCDALNNIGIGNPNRIEGKDSPMSALDYAVYDANNEEQNELIQLLQEAGAVLTPEHQSHLQQRGIDLNSPPDDDTSGYQCVTCTIN